MTVEVPLLTLPSAVLFPGMALPLHIAEPHLAAMVQRCVDGDGRFGAVLARPDDDEKDPGGPSAVGTIAQIHEHHRLETNRYLLLVIGQERFRLLSEQLFEGTLLGTVEFIDDDADTIQPPAELLEEVGQAVIDHMQLVRSAAKIDAPAPVWPTDPTQLSFALAGVLMVSPARRQELLELTSTTDRLRRVASHLRSINNFIERRRSVDGVASVVCASNGRLDHRTHLSQARLREAGG